MNPFDQNDELLVQISGPEGAPALVYVPGIHGDWTPLWRIRELITRHWRLVEIAYPRSATHWTLDDYVSRLGDLFDHHDLASVHLLAESFGSLIGWTFACRHPERVRSLLVAGGFSVSPGRVKVAAAELALHLFPAALLDKAVDFYLLYLIRRGFPSSAFHREGEFFTATRTSFGWRATRNRLKIIRKTDLRGSLGELRVPIFYFGGAWDWIVPVNREIATLNRHLHPACKFHSHLFPKAPHPIIPSRYRQVAQLIFDWIHQHETPPRSGSVLPQHAAEDPAAQP